MTKRKKSGKRKSAAPKRKNARRKQKKGGRRFSELLIVGALLLAAYFAIFGGEYSIFELKKLEGLELARAAELAKTKVEIDSLRQVAERLRTDAEAIERVARERYGMIREGEILYRFREAEPAETVIDEDEGAE